jgi:transposase
MKFYTQTHQHYCGIDLHARSLYVCIMDRDGTILAHKNIAASPAALLAIVAPYRDDLVIGVECMFTWYWVADLCRQENIAFILGHALYLRAIHGGKAKNDKIDSQDRHADARRDVPGGLHLPARDARYARPDAPAHAPDASTGGTASAYS